MNLDAFRSVVYDWFSRETKMTVIMEEQAEARPQRPYASFNIITGAVMVGEDDQRQAVPGTFTWEGQRRITVSFSIWADNALEVMADVQSSLRKASNQLSFTQAGVSPSDYSNVQKLTTLFGTRFELRAQMDVIFTVVQQMKDDVKPIVKVTLDDTAVPAGTVTEII